MSRKEPQCFAEVALDLAELRAMHRKLRDENRKLKARVQGMADRIRWIEVTMASSGMVQLKERIKQAEEHFLDMVRERENA